MIAFKDLWLSSPKPMRPEDYRPEAEARPHSSRAKSALWKKFHKVPTALFRTPSPPNNACGRPLSRRRLTIAGQSSPHRQDGPDDRQRRLCTPAVAGAKQSLSQPLKTPSSWGSSRISPPCSFSSSTSSHQSPPLAQVHVAEWVRCHCRVPRMLNPWLDQYASALEAHQVIWLRTLRIARGCKMAEREAKQMVTEKVEAAALAGALFATGSVGKIAAVYRRKFKANKKRLSI